MRGLRASVEILEIFFPERVGRTTRSSGRQRGSAEARVAIISSAALNSEPSAPPRQRWTSNAATEKDAFSDLLGGELGK